jgi:dihydroneopterin aldolase
MSTDVMGDRIELRGIAANGHHGVFDFERTRGQRFVVDVTCWLDLSTAADSDDLTDTLDYGALTLAVVADIEGEPVRLIEALARRIARTCLAQPQVETVQVTVHKPEAPIEADVADVAVTLTRSRSSD